MKKIQQSIEINAPLEVVWAAIINDHKYRIWTAAFDPSSHFVGGWQKGDKIKFIGSDDQGHQLGMAAEIAASDHLQFISIHMLGLVKDDVIDTESEDAREWAPAFENYHFDAVTDRVTKFSVDVDTNEDYFESMNESWTQALLKLRDVCENNLAPFTAITVSTDVQAPIDQVWACWTSPDCVRKWNHASDDWYCPAATNDLRVGGRYVYTMSAVDKSFAFDFAGTYTEIVTNQKIVSQLDDGRMITVTFDQIGPDTTRVIETFEAENENSFDLQRSGWQAILDNFKQVTSNK